MDFLMLSYFKVVAQTQNMTQAAEQLMVTQPAVSKMIQKLELGIGYPLFDRKGRNIVLNANGKILLKHTDKLFNTLQNAREEIAEANSLKNLNINILLLSGSKLFSDILVGFRQIQPHCQVCVSQYQTEPFSYDLMIYSSSTPPKEENHKVLLKERIMLVVQKGHRLWNRTEVSLGELKDEKFLTLTGDKALRSITDELCKHHSFVPNIFFEADNPSFLREVTLINQGIAFMPEISWGRLDTKDTKAINISENGFVRYINIAHNPNRYLNGMAESFKKFVIGYYSVLAPQKAEEKYFQNI